jgi:uncharacterized membrane protein
MDTLGDVGIVLAIALVTLATRWGGVYIMSFIPIGYRVRQFIQAVSGSVLVAILAPMAYAGDERVRWALLATGVVMLVLRKPLPAIACGVVLAAVL